jgi:hypothetical protein
MLKQQYIEGAAKTICSEHFMLRLIGKSPLCVQHSIYVESLAISTSHKPSMCIQKPCICHRRENPAFMTLRVGIIS